MYFLSNKFQRFKAFHLKILKDILKKLSHYSEKNGTTLKCFFAIELLEKFKQDKLKLTH